MRGGDGAQITLRRGAGNSHTAHTGPEGADRAVGHERSWIGGKFLQFVFPPSLLF